MTEKSRFILLSHNISGRVIVGPSLRITDFFLLVHFRANIHRHIHAWAYFKLLFLAPHMTMNGFSISPRSINSCVESMLSISVTDSRKPICHDVYPGCMGHGTLDRISRAHPAMFDRVPIHQDNRGNRPMMVSPLTESISRTRVKTPLP